MASGCGGHGSVKLSEENFSLNKELNVGVGVSVPGGGASVTLHLGEAATALLGASLDLLKDAGRVWNSATSGAVVKVGDK
jgi:hypothetical protein